MDTNQYTALICTFSSLQAVTYVTCPAVSDYMYLHVLLPEVICDIRKVQEESSTLQEGARYPSKIFKYIIVLSVTKTACFLINHKLISKVNSMYTWLVSTVLSGYHLLFSRYLDQCFIVSRLNDYKMHPCELHFVAPLCTSLRRTPVYCT